MIEAGFGKDFHVRAFMKFCKAHDIQYEGSEELII